MKILLQFYFLFFISFSFAQSEVYSEQVLMPDGTTFTVTKNELILLDKYKARLETGNWYSNLTDMYESYKKNVLYKREMVELNKKEAKLNKKADSLRIVVAEKREKLAKENKAIDSLRIVDAEKREKLAKAEEDLAKEKEKNQNLQNDLNEIDNSFKNLFEGQLHRSITDAELKKYYTENETWNKSSNNDKAIIDELKKSKENNKKFTKTEQQKIINLKIKYKNMKKSDLKFINDYNTILLNEIINLSK